MECLFCNKGWLDSHKLYEDEHLVVYLDMDPISKGHILILPRKHYVDIDEMPSELIQHIFIFAKRYVSILKSEFKPAGYSMMQNGGAFNDIQHFHLHVFPRFSKEEFQWTYLDENDPESMKFESLRARFKSLLT